MKHLSIFVTCILATGCARPDAVATAPAPPVTANWKRIVTAADLGRLREWRTAFVSALAQARDAGSGAAIDREGALLVPDAALEPVALPSGRYRCRVVKLGAQGAGASSFTPYPAFDCRVNEEGEVDSFAKMSGSQRPVGLIFDDGRARKVFLGTLMLGDETHALEYGADASRDMAGAVQRIGDKRWRLILPYPRFESVMDVVELVPA